MDLNITKPSLDDADEIYKLIHNYSLKGLILERTSHEIKESLHTFLIAKSSSVTMGIISFHDYGNKLYEIRSLAVSQDFKKYGIGSKILNEQIKILRSNLPDCKIFTLTYSPDFFKKNSFTEVNKESLPEKIWKDCNNCKDKVNCGETALVYSK